VTAGEPFGEIESVKATGDLVSGVSGEVIEVNGDLANDPSLVNSDPHDGGWMIKVKLSDPGELEKLLPPEKYESQTGAG
jgi:glycine cleavage system H protein